MRQFFVALFMVFAFASFASAAPILLHTTGTFGPASSGPGTFYNQVQSWDGAGCGIGGYLTGSTACGAPGVNVSPLNVLGTGASVFAFESFGVTYDVSLMQAVSAHTDEFGWVNSANQFTSLFDNKTLGASASFTPNGLWAFGFRDTNTGAFWQSDLLNQRGRAQFALFQSGDRYFVGAEDLWSGSTNGSDYDFNDSIVGLTAQPVPEPGSMSLMGMGLLFCARLVRKGWKVQR